MSGSGTLATARYFLGVTLRLQSCFLEYPDDLRRFISILVPVESYFRLTWTSRFALNIFNSRHKEATCA